MSSAGQPRRSTGDKIVRFALVGLVNTGIDLAAFFLLLKLAVPALAANVGAWFVAVLFSFVANGFWLFERDPNIRLHHSFLRFISLGALISLGVSSLSIAVLEELYRRGCIIMATTHFNEIKEYARIAEGFRNARMAFDEETLSPLYRLDMGEAGNSYAFVIAAKLGIAPTVIERAREIAERLKEGRSETTVPAAKEKSSIVPPSGNGARHSSRHSHRHANNQKNSEQNKQELAERWSVGDLVFIPHLRKPGVIYRLPDERGNLIVQVQQEKIKLNHKRIRKYIDKKHLYPGEDYDLNIVFDSVENRKKRHLMGKRHVDGLTIENPSED